MQGKLQSYKIIILGNAGVGKTSLANRQCRGQFTYQMTPTIGTSHMKTVIPLTDENVELKIWDTAGQEQFASLVSMYARGAHACIMVGSFCDPNSMEDLELWKERLNVAGENPPIIVAVNKTDMQEGAPLTLDGIKEKYGEKYPDLLFVSAKTGDGVKELFMAAADAAVKAAVPPKPKGAMLDSEREGKKGCC